MACTLNIFKVVLKTKVILLSVLKCFRLNNKNNYSTLHRVLMSNQFTFWVFHLLAKWSKMFCKHTLWAWSHHLILVCLADFCWKHLAVGYSLLWLQRQSLGQISLKSMRDQKLPTKNYSYNTLTNNENTLLTSSVYFVLCLHVGVMTINYHLHLLQILFFFGYVRGDFPTFF